uniref:Uncharacterized protein n=1 Tax=viral metagenome TaxID=1070528 RepID=A0A6M3KIX9_9ZZZZ
MIDMNNLNELEKLLENSKEDAPVSAKTFHIFLTNHFAHLRWQVGLNTKLLTIILGIVLAAAVTIVCRGL